MKLCSASVLLMLLPWSFAAVAARELSEPMLTGHNRLRLEVGQPPVEWSGALARSAQAWADRLSNQNGCTMKHSGPGENLFWASPVVSSDGSRMPQRIAPDAVVTAWGDEKADYEYATDRCRRGKVCGHYTQIVWRATTEIGCATRICADEAQLWVCQYRPAGNVIGKRPY